MTAPDGGFARWITEFSSDQTFLHGVVNVLVSDFFIPVSMALYMLFLWFGTRDPEQRVRKQYGVMCASASLGLACLVVELINNNIEVWPRPFEEYESARLAAEAMFYLPHDPSFPANLAGVAFGAAAGMCIYDRRASIPLFVLGLIWSMARVYAGLHYPLDILGGVAIGVAMAFFSYGLFVFFRPVPVFFHGLARKLYLA